MFRRKDDSASATLDSTVDPVATEGPTDPRPGGKGRPTPTRKEAEAAARARARLPKDKKAAAKLLRERRAAENAKMREGMKAGDPRYLPKRDQGPVRQFIRDFVDARVSFAEFLLPLLLIIMFMQYSGTEQLMGFSNALWSITIILVLLDSLLLRFQLRRQLKRRFPEEPLKGTTFYALLRALQIRFLRMPKPRVKLGQRLPEKY
ncbi:DUF3043 domain-containing protein [Nocardioides massiliensis]|uniref:DUF3043 domain-containing protein n=1 Tax=Nocardioides massiliensis TaxID=1325935 RepID=A0ABT9NT45_9ACTN|nr:DUF3043 domain-containing protein [Nocardioides massiliensis]MDP9823602.1 hypothetical protein [Nocardioides massiliensis]